VKRKSADGSWVKRITARRFAVTALDTPDFTGCVTLLCIDDVREPLSVRCCGADVTIIDRGYSWLQHFPAGAAHTLTTMFDTQGRVVQWYIDVCKQHGIGADGIPWYDDLYLDLVIDPSGKTELLDADELEEALRYGVISRQDYKLAWSEANRLVERIRTHSFPLLRLSEAHRSLLLALL
jgi:predicted RNA-binding protein associated with RNAse of E/G family